MNGRRIATLVIVAVALLGLGFLASRTINLMPAQASTRAVLVDELFRGLLGVATVIFLIVQGGLLYAVIRFRRRPGDETDGPPVHGNSRLELVWTLVPAVIVALIAFYSFRVLAASEQPEDAPLIVEVSARQFVWQFRYPEAGVTSAELHLPVGRQVRFEITSDDVIHSFWIPEFRVKRDATPGQVAELLVTPSQIGRYAIRCAELCGPGHATMTSEAVVESAADFATWLAGLRAQAAPADAAQAARVLFERYGCYGCHTLADAQASGTVGPALDGIGERASSRVVGLDAEAYIRQSILEPSAFVVPDYPDGLMPPNFGERMTPGEIDSLVGYLLTH